MTNAICNICKSTSIPLGKAKILNKYNIQYYSCIHCGFIQTEPPYWLEEAYQSALAKSDVGLVSRNIKLSEFCSGLIPVLRYSSKSCLDYGGGNGMFVRLMRDRGFDFYWSDKYAENQFAMGFEKLPNQKFSIVTAFEVFEHLPRPIDVVDEMFQYADTLIFSTRLLPSWRIMPDDWWYYALDTGQHVSLYSKETLTLIAKKFNVKFSSNGASVHILSQKKIPSGYLSALSFHPFSWVFSRFLNLGRKSLLEQDYFSLTNKSLMM